MWGRSRSGMSAAKALVAILLIGAVAFGLFLGYLEYENQSFPTAQKPFANYASVVSSTFNGTEVFFKVQWRASGNFTPLYAQITSSADGANSPVCLLGLSSVSSGQTIDMPFAVAGGPTSALSDVQLQVAVRANGNMSEFTIQYQMGRVIAQPGDITPSTFACSAGQQNPAM
jgi:hypothetical protein